ncbi:IPT/TIG domain-containing protein, partial [Skeletonema marinoi]
IQPKCKFGTAGVVGGVLVSQNEIRCVSPPAAMVETVELRLSIDNGHNFVLSSSWFTYTLAIEVEALIPSFGFRSGGTPILVTGRNFRNESRLSCKFGEASVAAIFISPQKVSCVHPPHQDQDGTEDQVIFTMGSDSGESTSWKYFEYIDDPVVASFHPLVGTSLGGADVVIRGKSFRNTIQLYCVFADIHVRAVVVDSSTMLCEIPRHPPGIVSFRVADQYDRTLDTSTELSSQFKFVPEPSIEAVNMNPSENATRAGLIFARGSNFGYSSEMSCIFGDVEQMTATVLAESILICETPQEGIGNMVNFSITHLGSEYSSQSLLPVGLDELLNAPNGTTMGHNVTLCEPGTFKPRSDQGMCLPCPVGYLCPLRGMSQPIVCPEGHICSKLGLVSPSSPCVPGNYCLQGTKSSHPMAYSEAETWHLDEESGVPTAAMERSLWDYIPRVSPATGLRRFFHPPIDRKVKAGQPLPCPVSYFCRKGVKTHHHVEGDYSTPQTCLEGHFCPRGSISPEGSGPCREGHYCPDNFVSLSSVVIPLAIPCDIGHYCPGTGNPYPRQCFPGSYNPTTGRSTCILCEIGRQCPEWGMSEPELCEAGFVCDIEGISIPTKLCPGGYICEEGTSTEKPYTSSGVGPKPCPPGSACPSGTAHNVTGSWLPSFELGRISPQPCSEGYHCPQNSSSIMGAGQCPPGHYCPPQSSLPVKVPPGTFAGEEGGAIAPSLCLPGTFSPQPGSVSCTECPAGYSCLTYGTYIPRICEPGTYRSKEDSLTCKPCPQRSLSPYSGLTDVSQCLPCPEGLVCSSKGMSDIGLSHSCPEGNACGYLTDGSSQYDHKCAAGHYCGEEMTTFDQYNKYCLAGTYCERGTTETLRTKNECNRGYYCSNGTPIPEPVTTRCPGQTTSLLGSEAMSMCLPESVAICDKMSHIESNPFDRMSYYPLDESLEDAAALREMAVVQKVLPFNRHTSNVEMWKNDTVEVTRACPSYIVQPGWTPKPSYGVRAEETPDEWTRESITIVGRNFRNSTALTCRYRTCLSSGWKNDKGDEIAVPERCFSDLTTSHLSEAETRAGTFISESRVSCPLPNIVHDKLLKSVNETNAEELSSQSLCVRDDEGGPFFLQKCSDIEIASGQCSRDDTVPELGLGRRIYSLFLTCSHEEVSRGLCANVPSPSLKLNPCFTSQVLVDVSNNGDKFSSDSTTIPYSLIDSDRDLPAFKLPPTYATYYVVDDHVLDAFESQNNAINRKQLISSFESDEAQCNLISSHEEEHRLDSDGWVEASYMNQFHLSFDWRLLPKHLVYDDHFRLAIHIVPSRCNESKCNDSTRHIRHEENIPCLQPVQLPEWFTDASIDKNQFMNITLLSLDDARFRVEVQLTHGLALPFADFFERTMTVIREQPQRAKTDLSASRTLSPLISWEERTVEMPWIFGIRYDESYSHSTNKYEDTEERKDFWSNPYQSEVIAKEQTDLYFETFHGLSFDQSTGSYDFDLNSLILPYLPFFSNCREFDSYIPLWALVESSTECKLPRVSSQYPDTWWRRDVQPLPHQDDVEAIGPSDFISFYPLADWCERKLHCSFEESLTSTDVTPRWFEADSGSTLFSILRDPIDFYQYTGRDSATVGANDGGGQRFLDTVTTLETFIPAKVSRSPAFNVVGDCAASCFPRRVTVDISYYQVDVHSKRVVQVNVIYDKFDKDSTNDEYELQFKFYPLNYQELVTKFAFTRGLFLMLFSYIGVGTVIVAMIYWAVLRLTTSLENPPQLKILGYLWLTFPPALGDSYLSDPDGRRWLFATTKLQYSDVAIDPDLLHLTRQGRTGLAFLTMAIASLYFTTKLLVPKKKLNGDHGDAKPITTSTWKRSNLLVSSILMAYSWWALLSGVSGNPLGLIFGRQ